MNVSSLLVRLREKMPGFFFYEYPNKEDSLIVVIDQHRNTLLASFNFDHELGSVFDLQFGRTSMTEMRKFINNLYDVLEEL